MNQSNPNSPLLKATLLVTSTLTVMSGATIAPSLPVMQAHFSEVENVAYWVRLVLTVPALFIVIGAPFVGQMIDRFGRKSSLVAATLIYGLAGSSGLILDSLWAILIGRALLGLSVAGVMTGVTTLIADYFTDQARANFLGMQAAFMSLGGVVFLSAGGFLADLNWRVPFLIYLFALILLPLVLLFLYEPSRTSSETSVGEVNAVRLPLKLLTLIYGLALLMQVIFYLIPVQLPFYLKVISNASATQSGLAIATATLASAIASLIYGRIKARLGVVSIVALAFGLMGIGYTIIGLVSSVVVIGLILGGLGLGLLMPNLNVWLTTETPDVLRGRALGGLTTFFFLGQFLSPLLGQPLAQQIGLGATYAWAGGLLLFLALLFGGMRRQIAAITSSKITIN